MDVYLALLLLTVIVVNLVDLSGFVTTVKKWVWKWVWKNKRPYQDFDFRPWECSYCMSHHVGVIYLLIVGQFSILTYTYLLVLAFLTPTIKDTILTVKYLIQKIIDAIYWYFNLDS